MPGPADEIKARLNAVELIGETVKLRRSGRTFVGLCPFHVHVKNTPSFVVWPESGTWRCFGQCNEGGDLFKFVMKKEGWGFREALEYLAGRAGVELKPRTPQDTEREETHKRLRDLLNLAVTYYRNLLVNAGAAQPARDHLQKRGLNPPTLETFEIGYALPAWEAAQKFFAERGFTRKEMVEAGMIIERDDGSTRDRFRNRIMIPIRDGQGKVVGFGARQIDPNDQPKFLNSPLTALFNKGDTVYALDRARKAISAGGVAVLVEGYMDVMAAHQAGFTNVVSAMGTALTETQLRLIKKYAKHIVLALDADAAGDKATLRGIDVARDIVLQNIKTLGAVAKGGGVDLSNRSEEDFDFAFDFRGLVETHVREKFKTDIRVFRLPDGLDPDELIATQPDNWKRGVEEAIPLVQFLINTAIADRNINDPAVKSEIANQLLPIISSVADPVERDVYKQHLAYRLRIDQRALDEKLAVMFRTKPLPRTQPPHPRPTSPAAPHPAEAEAGPDAAGDESSLTESAIDRLESYCLGALAQQPALVAKADRQLREWKLAPLSADDFSHTDLQLIFNALKAALDQHQMEPREHLQAQLDETFAPRLRSLLEASADIVAEDRRRVDDVLFAALRLRDRNIAAKLQRLRFLQEESQEDPELAALYQERIYNLTKEKRQITSALKRYQQRADRYGIVGFN